MFGACVYGAQTDCKSDSLDSFKKDSVMKDDSAKRAKSDVALPENNHVKK